MGVQAPTPHRGGKWEAWFLLLFTIQTVLGLAGVVYYEVWLSNADGLYSTLTNILRQSESLIIVIASETYVIVEGTSMLAERYKQKRFEDGIAVGIDKGRAEGRVEGRVEGRAEGREEGRAEVQQEWAEWNRRRESALAEGRPFTEPPPDIERASTNGSG